MNSIIRIFIIVMFILFAVVMLPIAIIIGLYAGTIGYVKKAYKIIKEWTVDN